MLLSPVDFATLEGAKLQLAAFQLSNTLFNAALQHIFIIFVFVFVFVFLYLGLGLFLGRGRKGEGCGPPLAI